LNRFSDQIDVLEFGEALVAARPRLRAEAEPLADTADEADRLVERAMKIGWRERRSFSDGDEVVSWLARRLVVRH
jgi:DNA-directed RNA polymerase specialized sigma24 family protein